MDFGVEKILFNLVHLGIAFGLALIIGWDREKHDRSAGLRTFPLVAVASCGFCLIGLQIIDPESQVRILYGIMTGIGFIGGGAILKDSQSNEVAGTATAASLWNTAAVGTSVAFSLYEIAVVLVLLNFFTLRVLTIFKIRKD